MSQKYIYQSTKRGELIRNPSDVFVQTQDNRLKNYMSQKNVERPENIPIEHNLKSRMLSGIKNAETGFYSLKSGMNSEYHAVGKQENNINSTKMFSDAIDGAENTI
jgi:hypothetical protein